MTKAGGLFVIDFKITNLSADDRFLEMCPSMTHFYDDLGNLIFPEETCMLNDCQSAAYYHSTGKVQDRYYCNGSSGGILPSNIPINAKITFKNINKRASHFIRGESWMKAEQDFKVNFAKIVFPSEIDSSNPNRRITGNQVFELKNASRNGSDVLFHFEVYNNSSDAYHLGIEGGRLWDNMGNENNVNSLSFVNQSQMIDTRNAHRSWNRGIGENSKLDVYLQSDNVSNSATQIRRLTVDFKDFEFSWENIDILENSTTTSSEDYISYQELETKIGRKEDVIGKKIVLENIYFTTGSDDLLSTSYTQLDRLANLMTNNESVKVEISGHTDNVGDDTANMLLSQKRADAVKYYLIGKSISPTRISSIGKGENEPIGNNLTESGKIKNRRVEIGIRE